VKAKKPNQNQNQKQTNKKTLYVCSAPTSVGPLLSNFIQNFHYQNVSPERGEVDGETIQK